LHVLIVLNYTPIISVLFVLKSDFLFHEKQLATPPERSFRTTLFLFEMFK
jgi:hypothetical protein